MMTAELLTFDPTEARRQRGLAIAAVCRVTQKNGSSSVPEPERTGTVHRHA